MDSEKSINSFKIKESIGHFIIDGTIIFVFGNLVTLKAHRYLRSKSGLKFRLGQIPEYSFRITLWKILVTLAKNEVSSFG